MGKERKRVAGIFVALCLALSQGGCAGGYFHDVENASPERVQFGLDSLPVREYWTGITFNGAKIGFTHFTITPSGEGEGLYEIRSKAVMHIRFLMMDKGVSLSTYDLVDRDLRLVRFSYEYNIDESRLRLTGSNDGGILRVVKSSNGPAPEEVMAVTGDLFPGSAVYLYPLLRGIEVGKTYTYRIYDGESQSISEVHQKVLALQRSELFAGEGFKIETRYLGQKITAWIDRTGLPLLEIALGGVLISGLESEQQAKLYLVESSLNRAESLLDFSLIRTVKPIRDPGSTKHLKVLIEDAPPDAAIPSDMRQACERQGTGVICSVRADAGEGSGGREVSGQEAMAYLRPSYSIQSSSPEILSLARRIMGSTTGRERQIRLVMDWMGDNIAKEPVDSFSALDVLSQKKGECQGHAYLYAALARSMGIPTRVASGIVYSGELGGFMYHAWAESLVAGAWIAVDPTLSQMPADATHIKLVEGETLASLVPLAGFMGRIRIEILEVE